MESLFSQVDPEGMAGLGIGAIFILGLLLATFLTLFLHHQRKMTALLHGRSPDAGQPNPQLDRIEAEVRELRSRVNQLILGQEDRQGVRELQERSEPPRMPEHLR
jgi:hypothetical protein